MKAAWLALVVFSAGWLEPLQESAPQGRSGVAILQVDTDRRLGTIDQKIYGQFLEHINHSVVDGLFAEQIRGAGFEGRDFETYWTAFGSPRAVSVVDARFEHGEKSLRIAAGGQPSGVRQGRVFLQSGRSYARVDLDQNRVGRATCVAARAGGGRKRAGGSSASGARMGRGRKCPSRS